MCGGGGGGGWGVGGGGGGDKQVSRYPCSQRDMCGINSDEAVMALGEVVGHSYRSLGLVCGRCDRACGGRGREANAIQPHDAEQRLLMQNATTNRGRGYLTVAVVVGNAKPRKRLCVHTGRGTLFLAGSATHPITSPQFASEGRSRSCQSLEEGTHPQRRLWSCSQ